jgi:hypothetical protein
LHGGICLRARTALEPFRKARRNTPAKSPTNSSQQTPLDHQGVTRISLDDAVSQWSGSAQHRAARQTALRPGSSFCHSTLCRFQLRRCDTIS